VSEDRDTVKLFSVGRIMTSTKKEALANSVPAAAVTRGGRALFDIIGRKGRVGFLLLFCV